MNLNVSAKVASMLFLLLIVVCWLWYSMASNFDYESLAGTYSFQQPGEASTLVLKKDRSFQQVLIRGEKTEHVEGSWRRIGEAGVVFSGELLRVPGQEVRQDGQVDAQVKKRLGLFLSIAFNPDPGGPVFHKKLFH